jgi:type IV pilus assembly protein PilZ
VHEQRRHPRVVIRLPIVCEVPGGDPFVATVSDLSVGGLSIESSSVPPFGTELTIVADFPGDPGLRLAAVVRWARPGGFGVQFGLLGARETHALTGLLTRARA